MKKKEQQRSINIFFLKKIPENKLSMHQYSAIL